MGIVLDPGLTNAVGPVRAGTQGYVTTYAQVAGKPMLHAARATAVKTLVILDEVHHAGDGLSWGEAAEEAFGCAARRLCLTGTPFRTKADERIPFVRYEEDSFEGDDGEGGVGLVSRADYTYGYKEALADSVVRPVVFAAYTGTSRWRNSAGEVVAASLSEAGTKSVEMQAWRTALDPKGQWVPHVIAAMDDRITHLRENGMPDAAGLILASDQDDARAYAKIVRRVTGKAAELILSDDPKASKKIERFATGSARIAVCVRMISEGVDVPRAAVLAWMTSYRTPLFFAQAVGRVVRARAPHESATVFLPAVRPLLSLAASMEEQRNHVMPPPKTEVGDELDLEPLPPKEKDPEGLQQWEALEADARFAHVLHSGTAHTGEGSGPTVVVGAEDEEFLGIPGLLTPAQTAELLSKRDDELRLRIAQSHRSRRRRLHGRRGPPRRGRRRPLVARRRRAAPGDQPAGQPGGGADLAAAGRRAHPAAAVGARPAVGVGVGRRPPRPPRAPPHDALRTARTGRPESRRLMSPLTARRSASEAALGGDGDGFGAAARRRAWPGCC